MVLWRFLKGFLILFSRIFCPIIAKSNSFIKEPPRICCYVFWYDNSKKRVAVIIAFTVIGTVIAITGYNLKQSIELTEEEQYYQDENYEIDSYREDSYLEEEVESDSGKEGIFSEGISESNVSDMQNIRVFLNISGESVLCMAEYDTPSSDGAIGEMMISNIDMYEEWTDWEEELLQ